MTLSHPARRSIPPATVPVPLSVPGREPAPVLGHLHSVETGAAADGPGVRFVYFLAG